jgi:hypothetical protein
MPTPEQNETITRKQFAEMKFNHQIQKAYRKGKLTEVLHTVGDVETKVLIDPAFVNFVYDMSPAVVSDPDHILFLTAFTPRQQKTPDTVSRLFGVQTKNEQTSAVWEAVQKCTTQEIYKLLVDADPTPNKEYVQWILTMYTRILKDREPKTNFDAAENKLGGFAYLFFENIYKLSDALKTFHRIKNTKLLNADQKDIYTYRSVDYFVEVVFSINTEIPTELNLNILNAQEIECINNKHALVEFRGEKWVVVHTVNREANTVFGIDTTWCTAGTRYGSNMFDTYNRQGKLFVLVKNAVGGSNHLKSNPQNRYQFHFESNQFMNVLDRSINILNFLSENLDVKDYFRDYIVNNILKKETKVEKMIEILHKYGMVKELIPILKGMKIKKLDLSGVIGKGAAFELEELGDLITLEELTMRDCSLDSFPEPIRRLSNLKILRLSGNHILKVPQWINDLKNLEVLNVMKNQITEQFDVSGLRNLTELHIGFNKKLRVLPTGLKYLKRINSIDCSICDIREIDDEILECVTLVQFNAIRNRGLTAVPEQLVNLPALMFLGLDETGISPTNLQRLNGVKTNKQTVVV